MTTPARNVNTQERHNATTVRQLYTTAGVPVGSPSTTTTSAIRWWDRDIRPASVSNPIRSDGSRAPSAWDHSVWQISAPRGVMEFVGYGGPGYEYRHRLQGPLTNAVGGLEYLMSALGAGWIARQSGVAFPYGPEAEARTKVLTKLKNQDYSFGETLAEIGKTGQYVVQACGDSLSFVENAARRTKLTKRQIGWMLRNHSWTPKGFRPSQAVRSLPRSLRRKADVFTSLFLQFQFAVKPLLYDIQDASRALGDALFGTDPPDLRVRVVGTGQELAVIPFSWLTFWNAAELTGYVQLVSKCRIVADYMIDPNEQSKMQRLGLDNSFSVLYNVAPWSWMFDYISNTGSWLGTLIPVEGARFVEGVVTRRQEVSRLEGLQCRARSGWTITSGPSSLRYNIQGLRLRRDVLPLYGVLPAFRPVIRNKLNLEKVANSVAALKQAFL